jgi:hypothetical protein
MAARRPRPEMQPMKLGRRGPRGTWDPFYQFEQLARDHGEPPKPAKPPKGEVLLVEMLASKTAAVVMGCVLAFVVIALLVLLVFKG